VPARPGLRLLLCSDGLTKEVDAAGIRHHLAAGLSAQDTARALESGVHEGGGRDNITTVVIDVLETSGLGEFDNTIPRTAPTPTQ
jgi:serine/threonine protein phosphatase PrpC